MAKKIIQNPRGTRDILPEEQRYFDFIYAVADAESRRSGFDKIETPIIEDASLFERGVGKDTDIVEKEMYTFKDKSGNVLALRPEGTASVVGSYIQNGMQNLPKPLKFFYYGPMFRYGRPQAGRYRQFYHFGVEIIGDKKPINDLLAMSLMWRICSNIGLTDISLQINSIGCPNCRPKYKKQLLEYIKESNKNICKDCQRRAKKNPLRVLDCKEASCQNTIEGAPVTLNSLCKDCHDHFRELLEYLDELEIGYELNPKLVRGLDYYTKTVFEIWTKSDGGQNSLGGGGRYDGLIELLGGKPTPAVGFSLGVDRIVDLLKNQKIEIPATSEKADVFVAQLGDVAKKKCIRLMHDLHMEGVGAEGCIEKKGISDQLKMANKLGVPITLLIGQKEAFDNTVIIKDMQSGNQEIYPREKVVREIKKRLNSAGD